MDGNLGLESISRLNSHLNSALIQIGRTFRDANGSEFKSLGITRDQEARMDLIANANSKFHEVLDEIEIEILQAKSALERDLNVIRTAREERERAAGAADPTGDGGVPGMSAGGSLAGEAAVDLLGDLTDPMALDTFAGAGLDPATFDAIASGVEPPEAEPGLPTGDGDVSAKLFDGADDTVVTTQATDANVPAEVNNDGATKGADAADNPLDFESFLASTGDDQHFDLDFSDGGGDVSGNAGGVSLDDLFNEIGASTGDFTNLGGGNDNVGAGVDGATSAEDLDSLLPGFGNYVNVDGADLTASGTGAGDDFAMIDLPEGEAANGAAGADGAVGVAANTTTGLGGDGGSAGNDNTGDSKTTEGNADANQMASGNGSMGDIDDFFSDMLDGGNIGEANLDDFDWTS